MAKDGSLKSSVDPSMASLKKELQRLVRAIVDDDEDCVAENEAVRVLSSLRDLKFKKSTAFKLDHNNSSNNINVPEEFKCPISRELMRDPVILSTGLWRENGFCYELVTSDLSRGFTVQPHQQTYDRPYIERWLSEGHKTCPQTQQVLSHTVLTPNHLVQEMISHWCAEHGFDLPRTSQDFDERAFSKVDSTSLDSLLEKMSSCSLSDQKEAAKELRLMTKRNPSFREVFSESKDSITRLLSPFNSGQFESNPDLQEDLITTLLNLSIFENNRIFIVENQVAMTLLVESLHNGNTQTKSNAAAALFTLSDTDSNKLLIGNAGVIRPLIELLDKGNPQAMKDAASAIFNLCIVLENKRAAVHEGAVPIILNKIKENVMVAELLAILALLSVHQKAVDQMEALNAVPLLLGILRESSCEASKENSIAILYTICYNDRVKLREIKAEEAKYGTVSRLARTGTSRARRKADGILQRINRAALLTHTA